MKLRRNQFIYLNSHIRTFERQYIKEDDVFGTYTNEKYKRSVIKGLFT